MEIVFRIIAFIWALQFSNAYGQCVTLPNTSSRADWSDIEKFKANENLNNKIGWVQDLEDKGHGKLNIDIYSITIDANQDSPESLFLWFKMNLDQSLFSGTDYSLKPYDKNNARVWNSDTPKGALMTFTLAAIGDIPLEKGSVVVSCYSSTDFIFSTVYTDKDGLHPVAGNRAFGVRRAADGGLVVFVKASDRVVNSGIFSTLPDTMRESIFEQGHNVWVGMLNRLKIEFSKRNPRGEFIFNARVPYE